MASNYVVAGSVGRLLREQLSSVGVHVIENMRDPVLRGIALNTDRVESRLGRPPAGTKSDSSEFTAQHIVTFGRSGTIEYAALAQLLGNDNPPMLTKSDPYPAATTVPQRTTDWLTIGLKKMKGNLVLHENQALALENGQIVEDFLSKWLSDPWEIILQQMATDFFNKGYGTIAQVAANVGSVSTGATGTVTLTRTVRGMWRGQRVTIWNNSAGIPGATRRGGSSGTWVVVAISNYDTTPTVTLLNEGDASTLTADDHIVLKGAWDGTNAYGVGGIEGFADNTLPIHGLSRTTYPELKAYSDSNGGTNREPVPSILQKAIDAIVDRGWDPPNRAVTTRGVRSLYYQNEGTYKSYVADIATPVQPVADGGNRGNMRFTTEEEVITVEISAFCPKHKLYLYRPDCFIHYAPKGMEAVQFLGASPVLGGGAGINFLPSIDGNGQYTGVFEAPFKWWFERGCLKPQSLGVISDLKELADVA